MPENNVVLPALVAVRTTASATVPNASSSRNRWTMNSE